ncbi:hypothetical protein PMAYCL1PPCAC_00061, partial [Pristionchus mayeri]
MSLEYTVYSNYQNILCCSIHHSFQRTPITIDDGDKPVKREAEEVSHPMVEELTKKLDESEQKVQRLISISGEKQGRIEYLEERIECLEAVVDQKRDVLKENLPEEP